MTKSSSASSPPPDSVAQYAAEARRYVEKALSVPLDGTSDTLPILDHYLNGVAEEASEIIDLVAVAAGCYFGEVVRAHLEGSWSGSGPDPSTWELHLSGGDLRFSPVAVAYQAICRGANEQHDDALRVPTEVRPVLEQALDRLPRLPEETYYSLSTRLDTLETVMDYLAAWRQKHPR